MSATSVQPVSVEEIARRFGKGTRWAMAFMRQVRHVGIGPAMWTTEEWLAEWLAAESVPQRNWPRQNLDPLEEVVASRLIQLVGDLAANGKLKVVAV